MTVRRVLAGLAFIYIGVGSAGLAQAPSSALRPPGTGGVAALANALEQLGAVKRVLVIGAHPDDEDSELLTWLSRGAGAQAAYLSLSRGEGGQNLIGPELGPELGLIRSAELLAARELDGARQYFARAYDFGFSKSAEETFRFWPRDSLVRDVLDVIRRFRPQILVSIWSGTPRDGHGQHQVSGLVAHRAYELLADSGWGPVKLYRSVYPDPESATLTIPAGTLDPILGQSYHQVAMSGRSRHRSQDMGQLQRPGPRSIRLAFVAAKRGVAAGTSLFAGVDTVPPGRERFLARVDSARALLNPWTPETIVPYLARALHELDSGQGTADVAAVEQRRILEDALATAAGVAIDGIADDGVVTAGQRLQVEVTVWNAGAAEVRLEGVEIGMPPGWTAQRLDAVASPLAPGTLAARRFIVTVAPDAPRSESYFLRRPLIRGRALYDWAGTPAEWRGLPFEPPPLEARVRLTVAGEPVTLTREIVFRYRDQAVGEVRRPILVTRDFDVAVSPELAVWPVDGAMAPRRFVVSVTNRLRAGEGGGGGGGRAAAGRLHVTPPPGWSASPIDSLAFGREDETKSVIVTLTAPPEVRAGTYSLRLAMVGAGGRRSEGALTIIDYPHIRPRPVARASAVEIRAARIALPMVTRVGYVRGAADRMPEELQAIGVPVEILGPDSLARGDLSRYDAIVIGSRAYETDPALVAHNGRVLDYARGGGLVIVQYQQYDFVNGGFAPYRLSIARPHDRVTDESAAVTPLDPEHPVFRVPNAIGPADWAGWVQERGLYFARDWDTTYVPLLETGDPGGPPLRGGLLLAPLGRGLYVYTGLSFFRQLPAGVPGAYRLFMNLLALRVRGAP